MEEEHILKLLANHGEALRNEVRSEIQLGLKEFKTIILEREQKVMDRLSGYDIKIARYDENMKTIDCKVSKLFKIVDEIRESDQKQNEEFAASKGADQKATQMRNLWIAVAGLVLTALAFVVGLKSG